MENEEQKVVRSYVESCEELKRALNDGWKVKFITPDRKLECFRIHPVSK